MRFATFPLHLSKVLRLPRKSDACSYEVLHLSRKFISANLKIWCSKMQPVSGNQRPDLLTALTNMSLVPRLPRKMHLCRSSSNVPRLPLFLEILQNPHALVTFDKVHNPLRLPREHLNLQKWSVHGVLCTFWLRNVLRATTACTFSTKWSEAEVLCTFWLWNVLRATTACNFSSLIWPAGSAPAALASRHKSLEKHSVSRLSYLFAHLDLLSSETFSFLIFFLLLFPSLTRPISAFHLSILSEVWLLNFLRISIIFNIVFSSERMYQPPRCSFNFVNLGWW